MKSITINFSKVIIAILLISPLFINTIRAQNVTTYNAPFAVQRFDGGIDTADIDNDGDLDILYSGEPGNDLLGQTTMHLYKNDGSGNFTEVTSTGLSPISEGDFKFADVDGDNDLDVLIVGVAVDFANSLFGPSARLYLNDGSGNFTYKSGTPFTANSYSEIAFADVDGDNDQDVCIVGEQGSALYINDGLGNFSLSTSFSALIRGSVAFGDINGDNHQDLLITGRNSSNINVIELYTNNGSGTFTLVNSTPFTAVYDGKLMIKDIDGDNDNDILVTGLINGNPGVGFTGLYWNDGSGNLTLDNNTAFIGKGNSATILNTGGTTALIEDFDGDNDMDILIAPRHPVPSFGETKIYVNDGTNKFHFMNNIWMNGKIAFDIAYGDIDGDGIKDFIANGEDVNNSNNAFTGWFKNTHITKANKAIDFDGTNIFEAQHLDVLNTTPLDAVPITIEFWAKSPTTDTDIGLLKKTDATKGGFEIYTASGILHAKYNKDASNHVAVQSTTTINDDAWHHIAFTVDNSNANLYIDGILIQTNAWTGTGGSATNTENIIFGQGTNNYNGLLDEVRIWNTARTISQIRENMYGEFAKPTDEATLIANYTMDVYSDSLIMDVSQYYNRAAISGGSVTLVDELVNYSNATSTTNASVQNANTTIGKFTFDDATANGNDPFDAPIQIVVAEITGAPNVTTGITEPNIDNRYFVVQLFNGAGTYSVDVSINSNFPDGSTVALYRRDDHSTGAWTLLTTGTVTGGKAVFNNISSFSQLMMASTAALPVEFISFTGQLVENDVVLNWQTATEENNEGFEIERSVNGTDWENIGFVQGNGTTTEVSDYEFSDGNLRGFENLLGLYYRLKQTDYDGKYEYSNIVNITMKLLIAIGTNNEIVKVFPNPATDILNIETSEPTLIQIINTTGQILKEQQINTADKISIEDLPNGIYFIRTGQNTQKIIIQR